jgi:hypothetical protein
VLGRKRGLTISNWSTFSSSLCSVLLVTRCFSIRYVVYPFGCLVAIAKSKRRQILRYTESEHIDHVILRGCLQIAESILSAKNEAIREQENEERLRVLSNSQVQRTRLCACSNKADPALGSILTFWQGIDLGAPSRLIGKRRILKEGTVTKGLREKKIDVYLFNDTILLTIGDTM